MELGKITAQLQEAIAPLSRTVLARFGQKTGQVTARSPARGSALIEIGEAVRGDAPRMRILRHIVLCTSYNIGCLHERRKEQSPQVPRLELRAL